MAVQIELKKFVPGKERDSALEFLRLLQEHQAIDVCDALLAAVESGKLTPFIFEVFLSATKSIDCIVSCLHQSFSIIIRKEAIKQYGKALKDITRWKEAWHYLGNSEGILKYLSSISVNEVKHFCAVVGQCNYGKFRSQERSTAVEQLLKAMNSSLYPDAPSRTPDERPLGIYANRMVPACSTNFAEGLIREGKKNPLYAACPKRQLIKAFSKTVYDYTNSTMFEVKTTPFPQDVRWFLSRFVHSEPMEPGNEKHFSASMEFSESLLERRVKNPDSIWPHEPTESTVYFNLLNRCIKKRIAKKRLHAVFNLGLRLIESKPKLKDNFSADVSKFWSRIVHLWVKWPEYWEDLLVKCVKLDLAGSGNLPNKFQAFLSSIDIKPDRAWAALRLFCLHTPKVGLDINYGEALNSLAKLKWDIWIFQQLPKNKVIRVLKLLLRPKLKFDLLSCSDSNSILHISHMPDQRNINALLYLIQLQVESQDVLQYTEGFERAKEAYLEYKDKCIASKEQQDRAQYAKAMGLFAIASGSLELYGEHVAWLARFIRDPLTVKVVFSRDAVANKEVSDLLSAIPKRIDGSIQLSNISEKVSIANAILLNFHEHHKIAKREPSYQTYDWTSVTELVADTISKRIGRAESLQKHLGVSQAELYSQIWSQTFALYSQSGAKSMQRARQSMINLLTGLPSKLLTKVAENMLEIDNKYRATKAQGKEAEDESNIFAYLAAECLLALAGGDQPTQAGDLIVHFVIDRPDASSWHRQMLSSAFFKRLPAKYAQQLLLRFSKIIGEKLEEQSYVRVGEAANAPAIVKVTTVKYLAQILQDAEFLSAESSIDVLLELFKVATHPDVRLATLESMLSALSKLASSELPGQTIDISKTKDPLVQKILLALDAVVPVIGSINERRPPTEQVWKEAEIDLSLLPNPSSGLDQRLLWHKLADTANSKRSLKGYFIQRLLLPGLQMSISAHRRWLALFLKKHNAGFLVDRLPAVIPASPMMMANMNASFLEYIPKNLFKGWNEFVKFLLQRPPVLDKFISKLEADEKINGKPDVVHFLNVFKQDTGAALNLGLHKLIPLIHHTWQPSLLPGATGISVSQVQDAIMDQAQIILLNYDRSIGNWAVFLHRLRHPTSSNKDWQQWKETCYPLLPRVVIMIDGMRTLQWSVNPYRRPSILPTTARVKLWMLDHPIQDDPSGMADTKIANFGQQLVKLLPNLMDNNWSLIKAKTLTMDILSIGEKISDRQKLRVGLTLGTVDRAGAVEESIRVSLAIEFIDRGRKALKEGFLKGEVANMLQHWQKSSVEDVREMVLNMKHDMISPNFWHEVFAKD